MNEEAVKYAFDLFVKDGYGDNIDDFRNLMKSDPKAIDYVFNLFVKNGYGDNINDFKNLLGITQSQAITPKKKGESMVSDSEVSSSGLPSGEQPKLEEIPFSLDYQKQQQQVPFKPSTPVTQPEQKRDVSKLKEYDTTQQYDRYGVPVTQFPTAQREEYLAKPVQQIETKVKFEEKKEELEKQVPGFLKPSVETIDKNFLARTSLPIISDLNRQYKEAGFEFSGNPADKTYLIAKAPNGQTLNINLGYFNNAGYINDISDEAERLKVFIKENSPSIPTEKVNKLQKEYEEGKQEFLTQKQIDESNKSLSKDLEDYGKRNLSYTQSLDNLKKSIDEFNAIPESQRNTPEYINRRNEIQKQTDILISEENSLKQFEKDIEAKQSNLKKSLGEYTKYKENQGTFAGGIWNSISNTISSMVAGTVAAGSDIITGATPAEWLLGKEEYEKQFTQIAKEKYGIEGDKFDDIIRNDKLTEGRAALINSELKDRVKKERKYGKEGEEGVIKYLRGSVYDLLADKSTTEQWAELKNKSFIPQAILGVSGSLPNMLMPGGWIGRALGTFISTSDGVFKEMENSPNFQNISENEKWAVAAPLGMASATLEEIGLSSLLKGTNITKYITKMALDKAGANVTPNIFKGLVKKEVQDLISNGTLKVVNGFLAEAETGALQTIAEFSIKDIYNTVKDKKDENGNPVKMFDTPDTVTEWVTDVLYGGAVEGVGGLMISSGMAAASAFNNDNFVNMDSDTFKAFVNSSNDLNVEKAFISDLKNKIASGDMTMAEGKDLLNKYRQAKGLLNSLPSELDEKDKRVALDLLSKRKKLEDKIQGKDTALAKPIQNRIDQINEQLNQITENAIQKQTAGEVPVQPEAGVGEEVVQGKPETGLEVTSEQVVTEEKPKEEVVTPEGVVEKKDIQVYRGTSTGNKSDKDGVSYHTTDRGYAAFYETGKEKPDNKALEELEALTPPNKPNKVELSTEEEVDAYVDQWISDYEDAKRFKPETKIPSREEAISEMKQSGYPIFLTQEEVDNENKKQEKKYNSDLEKYNQKKLELEDKAKNYLSPKKISGNFFNLGIDFSKMNPQQIFEKLKSLGISSVFKGGNFLDNYHSDLTEYARKNNIDFYDGITGGVQGSMNTAPQEIIEVSKLEQAPAEVKTPEQEADLLEELLTGKKKEPAMTPQVETMTPGEKVMTPEAKAEEEMIVQPEFTEQDQARKRELEDALKKADKRKKNVMVGEVSMPKAEVKAELDALRQKEQAVVEAEVQSIEKMLSAPEQKDKGKIRQAVTNAVKAIAKILPNTKIVLHETSQDYVNATGDTDNASGLYVPSADGGTIHINLSNANTRTVGHEVFHATLLRGIKTDAEAQRLAKAMIGAVAKSLKQSGANQELLNELENFLSNYDENIQNEEYLAEVFGYLADGYPQLTAPEKSIINRFIERIMKLFGLKPMTDKEVIDFMNTLSRKVATGEEITEKEAGITKRTKGISNITKRFQANFIDPISRLSFVYDKNSEKFENLKKQGFITTDKSLSDFNGKFIFLHQPDAAFSGMIYKNNELLVEGKGGVFYPIKFHEDGYFWASTSKTAKKMADDLNKVLKQNNGIIYMALTSAPYDKLMSSTTMSNAILDFFSSKAFDKNFNITQKQLKNALILAANNVKEKQKKDKKTGEITTKTIGLNLNIKQNISLENIQTLIKEKLNPDNSSFADRKNFAEELIRIMAENIKEDSKAIEQFGKLFSEGIQNKYFKGITKTGKLSISAANMTQALSEMFTEPILKEGIDREKGGQVYAILELNGKVKPVESNKHESYPMAIQSEGSEKVKVHVLNDRQNWYDVFEDFETNDIVTEDRKNKIYPTSGVSTRGLKLNTSKVDGISPRQQKSTEITTDKDAKPGFEKALNSLNETEQQREEWRKTHKVNQKQKRNPIVEQAVKDYYNEKITQEEYLDIVSKNQPIKSFKNVPKLPTLREITNSLDSSKVATGIIGLTKNLEDGEKVACRLDIPAYEDFDTWVVSIHDGNKEGKSIAYGQTAVLKNVDFKTFPGPAMKIAMGTQSKSTIARMFGNWVNEDPESVHARAKELMNDPAWTQVGMNPFRYSWFYDKADGTPISTADEVIQVGALVLAKNAKKVSTKDIMFETKSSTGLSIRFQKNNSQEIVKQARANGISDAGIRAYFKKNGLSDIEIDELLEGEKGAGKKIELSEETLPGYTKLMNRINGLISRGRKSGKSDDVIMQGVIANVEANSPEYANATDQQREQIIRDIRKMFGKKEKAAPSAEKITGKPKSKKVTVNEMAALKDQIRLEARAAREAKGDLNAKRKMLAEAINKLVAKGTITLRQANAIIKRVNLVNLDNPIMVERLLNYAEKVFKDAEYADKLSEANKLFSSIKQSSKSKEKNADLVTLAKEFLGIDPSMVENIDEYIQKASELDSSLKGSKATAKGMSASEMINIQEATEYISETIKAQEQKIKEQTAAEIESTMGVDASDLTYEQMLELLEDESKPINKDKEKVIRSLVNKMFDTYSSIIEYMFKTGKNPFVVYDENLKYEPVTFKESDKQIVREFMKMDLGKLSVREALKAMDALNNFIVNRSVANMGSVVAQYKAKQNAEIVDKKNIRSKPVKYLWSNTLGKMLFDNFASFPLLIERFFKSKDIGLYVSRMMGLNDLFNGASSAKTITGVVVKNYLDLFSKTKPNGKVFNDAFNLVERGMVAFMSRHKIGTDAQIKEEFNDRKNEIEESIKALSTGTKREQEKAKVYKEVYDKLFKDAKNADDIRNNADNKNIEAVDWWVNEWKNHYDELADVSLKIYNTKLDKDSYYTTDRYSKLEGVEKEIDLEDNVSAFSFNNGNISEKKAGSLMETRDKKSGLPKNKDGEVTRFVDLSFDAVNANSLYDALTDIKTAYAIKQVKAFMKTDAFKRIVPDKEERDILGNRINLAVRNLRNQKLFDSSTMSKAVKGLNKFSSIGSTMALAGIVQPFKQTIPIAFNTAINTGRFFDLLRILTNSDVKDFINNSGYSIANRGIESSVHLESINKKLDEAAKTKAEYLGNKILELNEMYMKLFLANPDAWIARASWMAYYEKGLRKQGLYKTTETIKTASGTREVTKKGIDYSKHKINKEAADYAQMMIDRQQNITDTRLAGSIYSGENAFQTMMTKIFLPLASFRINQHLRMSNDLATTFSKTTSWQEKREALTSLSGAIVEMIVFRAIGIGASYLFFELASMIRGEEEDEEKKKRKEKMASNTLKGILTGAVTDILSPIPVTDYPVKYSVNAAMDFTQDLIGMGDEDKLSLYVENIPSFSSVLGTAGIFLDKVADIKETAQMAATGKFEQDVFGKKIEKEISEKDRQILAWSLIPSILTNTILPGAPETNNIMSKVKKAIKKEGKTADQKEKYDAFGGHSSEKEFRTENPEKYMESLQPGGSLYEYKMRENQKKMEELPEKLQKKMEETMKKANKMQ